VWTRQETGSIATMLTFPPLPSAGTAANPHEYFIDISWVGVAGGNPTNSWGWHESPFGKLDYPAVSFTGHGGPGLMTRHTTLRLN